MRGSDGAFRDGGLPDTEFMEADLAAAIVRVLTRLWHSRSFSTRRQCSTKAVDGKECDDDRQRQTAAWSGSSLGCNLEKNPC